MTEESQRWRPQITPRLAGPRMIATITCRVCLAREQVPLDNPVLLCVACRADLEGALTTLDRRTRAAELELSTALVTFRTVFEAAHARDQARYWVVVQLVAEVLSGQNDDASARQMLRSLVCAGSTGDGLAALLAAEVQLRRCIVQTQRTIEHLRLAREEWVLASQDEER